MSKCIQVPTKDQNDCPNGGFPPLYVCASSSESVDGSESVAKLREFTKVPGSVPIQEILEKRSKSRFFFD